MLSTNKVPLFMLDRPLGVADMRRYDKELRALQGNVLKSHGREATASVILSFKPGKVKAARTFIRNFAARVTSARVQYDQTQAFKASSSHHSEIFRVFYLTALGYRYLGCDTEGHSRPFVEGMRAARKRLGDPPVATWDATFRKPIHAMVTVAHNYQSELLRELAEVCKEVEKFAAVSVERGLTMRSSSGGSIDHFGFLDGVSQPLFFEKDVRDEGLPEHWESGAGPNLVLVRDPLGTSDIDCGTYVVFRKLEQRVKRFKQKERALARRLRLPADHSELAGALMIGRFRDGTPVVLADREKGHRQNDFSYALDRRGDRCPLFAHVRKMNPRGESVASFARELSHRIARRGITYGDPTPPGDDESSWPEGGVGILFQCCQADLANQFEFIQKRWATDPDAPRRGGSPDLLAGRRTRASVPAAWDHSERIPFTFEEFVRMLGGEYFFAPSINVLKRI
jgi:Dyp-type peroxidase family